ncbi:MAG TPA: SpoIID/LytB domain-containing protein, partial [Acidimicrobiales bacterium]|nr:SpoIID/LytB domain-containing protein [Acidimicrobiales bacterium]
GRGMGQYGALGYAIDKGWSYQQILDHFYGGTSVGHVATSTLVTVRMMAHDGQDTIAVQDQGQLVTNPPVNLSCSSGSPCAVRVTRTGPGSFRVYRSTSCAGGTTGWVVAGNVSSNSVEIRSTAPPSDQPASMLQLCELNDVRWLRGSLVAQDTGTSQATVNSLSADSYLRGVVPRESPAFWGTLGNGSGEQALEAQAVAARSYALAENRWPWAKTCDTTSCQVYGGRATQINGGSRTDLEGTSLYATSDAAVASTSGEVRLFTASGSGPTGTLARTEFSSSTGGFTAGGTFPAVVDDGDATASNPNHAWTTSVPVSSIQTAYGANSGALSAVNIVARNGLGDLGGRVQSAQLAFQTASVTISGNEFAASFGLKSAWFSVTNNPTEPYLALTVNGSVYGFAGATVLGSPATQGVQANAVGLAGRAGGYWVLTADGSVYAFGGSHTYGSLAGLRLNGPPHQIVATPSGNGYWIVASDGGVFSFGDAHFYGSTGGLRLNKPIVGMAPTADGRGYWLLGSDGGVFSFGDAVFHGSTGGIRLAAPVNDLAATADGNGYWLLASDGGVFSFGSATFQGSLPGLRVKATAVGIETSPAGLGYLVATSSGHVYGFGAAISVGGPADRGATATTVGVVYTH